MEKKGKILIVDDNEDVLLSLNMLLKPYVEGIRVINTPERIIGMMDSFMPDVIMLDMNFHRDAISGEEGYEWLEKILAHNPKSVVLFITAYVDTEKAVRAIKAALSPASTQALYYALDAESGTHKFFTSYGEFQAFVAKQSYSQ